MDIAESIRYSRDDVTRSLHRCYIRPHVVQLRSRDDKLPGEAAIAAAPSPPIHLKFMISSSTGAMMHQAHGGHFHQNLLGRIKPPSPKLGDSQESPLFLKSTENVNLVA